MDGFRIDAAKHMDHVILRTLSLRLEDEFAAPGGAPFYLVGETFTGRGGQDRIMDYVGPEELDGQFDFPLFYAVRDAIGEGQGFETLSSEVQLSDSVYGDSALSMSIFLGNHDVSRYATEIAGCSDWAFFGGCEDALGEGDSDEISNKQLDLIRRMSMSFAFVLTQPGVPLIYYGDEIGLAGGGDPDNRRPMPWDRTAAQDELLENVRTLGVLRGEAAALQDGTRRELWVDSELYVYARDAGRGQVAIIALHMGETTREQAIPIPTGLYLEEETVTDALGSGREFIVQDGMLELVLEPWEYVILLPDAAS
jgi:glycosidase